jgi:hypothetical protein
MKGMFGFLSRGFACSAVALVILSVLAMPTQGVRANDPDGGDGGGDSLCFCTGGVPEDCDVWSCTGGPDCPSNCTFLTCGCP